ncbi:parallel beta-helix repeat protein [Rhizobium mongolense]|uniref:Parallel beta-helix repeat protein n=1 Tax=Rhizobium mongolense TaxID=57676 RepID=A0A7W6RRD0_9HYPH|nr:parallel beta-helix repeat protein [Rhizobium mongolense]
MPADPLTGGELIYVSQNGNSRKMTLGAVGAQLLEDTGQTAAHATLGITTGEAGQIVMAQESPGDVRGYLDIPAYVGTRTALKALDTTDDTVAYLKESGREGVFKWTTGDYSTQVAGDTREGVYVKADDTAASSGAWVRAFTGPEDIRWYGAAIDGINDDTDAGNALLFGGNKHVYFPPGEYLIIGPLRVYENTVIDLHPDAHITLTTTDGTSLFVNGEVGNDSYATGYDGDGNIWIRGGTFDCTTNRSTGSGQAAFVQMAHAENIFIEGMVCKSLWSGHFIELNAIKHGSVRNCVFSGQVLDTGDSGRDAINIDFSYEVGFPLFGGWDGTVCDDILIEGNLFDGVQTSASSHGSTEPTPHQKNIKIVNNTIRNIGEFGIWGRYWDRPIISGNTIHGCGLQGIVLDTCERAVVSGNSIRKVNQDNAATHALQLQTCTNCSVIGNNISTDTGNFYAYALRAFSGSGNIFEHNRSDKGSSGYANITEDTTQVDRRFSKDLGDDAVWSITPPRGLGQGVVRIVCESTSNPTVRGEFFYRVVSSAAMTAMWKAPSATSAETTGALTGTTGTDGIMTVSADVTSGKIYIENRRGSSVIVNVEFMG